MSFQVCSGGFCVCSSAPSVLSVLELEKQHSPADKRLHKSFTKFLFVYFYRMAIIHKYRDRRRQSTWIPAQESAMCWDWWPHSCPFCQQRQPLHGMPKWQLQMHSSFEATSRHKNAVHPFKHITGREYQMKSSLHPGDWQKALHCGILLACQIAFALLTFCAGWHKHSIPYHTFIVCRIYIRSGWCWMYQKEKGPDHTPEAAMRSAWQIAYAALSHRGLPDIVLRSGLQKRQYSKQNPCDQVGKISVLISMLNAMTTFCLIRQVCMLWGKIWKESLVDFKFWKRKNMEFVENSMKLPAIYRADFWECRPTIQRLQRHAKAT